MPAGVYERTAEHRARAAEVAHRTHRGRKNTLEHNRRIAVGQSGARNHGFKGGLVTNTNGYVLLLKPLEERRHPRDRYVLEHRKVMSEHLGRDLLPNEEVHHKNGVRDDNRPENLELRTGPHGAGATRHCLTCTCCEKEG